MTAGPTRRLVDVASRAAGTADADALARAKLCALDWLAVTAAGARTAEAALLRELVAAEGGQPESSLVGTGERATARQAALFNGTASHVDDFDDVHLSVPGHATAPVAGALWGFAEARGASGRAFLAALVAGIEVAARLGEALRPHHYEAGWHASTTIGALSSAVACCILAGASADETEMAVGLAASSACGLRGAFGAPGKPFQVGLASANGVLAAGLALRGFRSQPGMLERPDGFFSVFGAEVDLDAIARPAPLAIRGVVFKRHANCFLTHAALGAAGRLRDQDSVRPDMVARIEVRGCPDLASVCGRPRLATVLDSKFSVEFAVAATLEGLDTAALTLFEADPATHAPLQPLMARITVVPDKRFGQDETELSAILHDGRTLVARGRAGRPFDDPAEERPHVVRKARSLLASVSNESRADHLVAALAHLDCAERVPDLSALWNSTPMSSNRGH